MCAYFVFLFVVHQVIKINLFSSLAWFSLYLNNIFIAKSNERETLKRKTTVTGNKRETICFYDMNFWSCFLEMDKVNLA